MTSQHSPSGRPVPHHRSNTNYLRCALEHRIRILERFTRLDQARARDSGGGLGLAISREIAQPHGGSLNLLPWGHRAGAVFELRLPLATTKRSEPL